MLERRENESELDYHRRLIYGKLVDHTLSDVDYTELAPLLYGQEYSADVARRMCYGSRKTLELLDRQPPQGSCTASMLEQLNETRKDLQKERYKLQSEKAEYNRWLREDARDELFAEKVCTAIREHIGEQTPIRDIELVKSDREAVVCIADTHFGKDITIRGLEGEVINQYNPEVFHQRMERLYNEVVNLINREQLSVIRVYHLGDSVDGFLRHSQAWSLRYGVVESAIKFGNYMGDWLRRLSEHANVIYAQTDGNHDEIRLLDGRKGQHLNESAGSIIWNCITIKNENNPNFFTLESATGLIYDNICGYAVLGVHELRDLASASKQYSNLYNTQISYVLGAHMHHTATKATGVRKGTIQVGSLAGVDDFAMSILENSDPTATTLIFQQGKGKVAEYTHVLN